jgi:hypothetical protein
MNIEFLDKEKITKLQLAHAARLLRGRRQEIVERSGKSIQTVNNTFQWHYPNDAVLMIIAEMVEEVKNKMSPGEQKLRMAMQEG